MAFGMNRIKVWMRRGAPIVAVLRLGGVIGAVSPLRGGMTLAALAPMLNRAFNLPGVKAVALSINSPGGSPVQSALIAKRIRALAMEKNLPVYAFIEDVAASGGYWLATAADEIYADANSIVGSIGVISAGFGFPELLRRHGIERRVYTSGERKGMLDPFQSENEADIVRLKALQAEIHENFRQQVKQRRALKLKGADSDLFSGEFWSGGRAKELGLIDGLGELRGIMRAHYGDKVRLVPMVARIGLLSRLLGRNATMFSPPESAHFADGLLAALEERAWWGRYGL